MHANSKYALKTTKICTKTPKYVLKNSKTSTKTSKLLKIKAYFYKRSNFFLQNIHDKTYFLFGFKMLSLKPPKYQFIT